MKLCKDCKHFWSDLCIASPSRFNYFHFPDASIIRATTHPEFCGPRGKFWEPKE